MSLYGHRTLSISRCAMAGRKSSALPFRPCSIDMKRARMTCAGGQRRAECGHCSAAALPIRLRRRFRPLRATSSPPIAPTNGFQPAATIASSALARL